MSKTDLIKARVHNLNPKSEIVTRPSMETAMEAVRTLIRYAGDDPMREGLLDTPSRVVRAYEEFFAGYREDAEEILGRTFEQPAQYQDVVILRDSFVRHQRAQTQQHKAQQAVEQQQ